MTCGQQGGTEGYLDAGVFQEAGEGVGKRKPLDRKRGGRGEKGTRFGHDADLTPQQRDLPVILGGKTDG